MKKQKTLLLALLVMLLWGSLFPTVKLGFAAFSVVTTGDILLFAGVRSRIENCPSPKCFKGIPITLISASIVALAFYGFAGVVENLLKI